MKLSKLFNLEYPKTLIFSEQKLDANGINFVSSSANNNGVVGRVITNPNLKKYPAGVITVPLKGSVLSAFVQPEDCYVAHQIAVLTPKKEMTDAEKLFYCLAIRKNQFRYNFGRQADKTLSDIELPDTTPSWARNSNVSIIIDSVPIKNCVLSLDNRKWKYFRYDQVFEIFKGYYNKKPPTSENGEIPFIGATERNNGITSRHTLEDIRNYGKTGKSELMDEKRVFEGNCITISNNGSVGYAFYQPSRFTCSHDVNPVYLKGKKMNEYTAMFLCGVIGLEKYRWNYGRKWRPKRMPSSLIKLPINKQGNPDWQFMEDFIKSLPYSAVLDN